MSFVPLSLYVRHLRFLYIVDAMGPVSRVQPPSDYFRLGKAMLRVWGLWPIRGLSRNLETVYKVYGIFIVLTTLIPYNVFSAMDAYKEMLQGQWLEIMPRFSVALAMLLGCLKVVVSVWHSPTINELMVAYEQPVFTYESTGFFQPNIIIRKCIWLYNIQLSVCIGLIGILITTDIDAYLKNPFILGNNETRWQLPFVNWLPYNYSSSPRYELSFFLINFWFFVSSNVIVVFDTICIGIMIHTGGQLKILQLALQTLQERAIHNAMKDAGPNDDLLMERIQYHIKIMFRKCAVHHQSIKRNIENFKQIYSTMIFLQFCISCLMICFTILIVTNAESPMSSRISSLIIFLCSIWELSVYCYFGNEITHESNKVSLAVYQTDWYLMDRGMKSNLLIMMIRAQKPIVITAGGFVPLSLETFMKILKASYSYYAFLRNASNK